MRRKNPPELNLEFLSQASALKSIFVFSKSPPLSTHCGPSQSVQLRQLPEAHIPVYLEKQCYIPIFWIKSVPMFPKADGFFCWKTLIMLFNCHYF